MRLLIVTPVHNEAPNIPVLGAQLAASTFHPALWVIVDDGSTDGSGEIAKRLDLPFPHEVVSRKNAGGLIGGSAFTAWQVGVDHAFDDSYEGVMKLDADVELPVSYLAEVVQSMQSNPRVALAGGILTERAHREQTLHVPGPVKLYSRAGYDALIDLPRRVGFDVMDELAIKTAGLDVVVRHDLPFSVRRAIGASQGLVHGRRRNGVVCRWTGYWAPYFTLHALRYVARKPYIVGTVAMVWGYLTAGSGPYSSQLRQAHSQEQRGKLRALFTNPVVWLRETYRGSAA